MRAPKDCHTGPTRQAAWARKVLDKRPSPTLGGKHPCALFLEEFPPTLKVAEMHASQVERLKVLGGYSES